MATIDDIHFEASTLARPCHGSTLRSPRWIRQARDRQWLRVGSRALPLLVVVTLAGCGSQPTQVTSVPVARSGTVESVREVVQSKDPSGAGMIVGGLVGGGLGSLVGSGNGRTVATIVGAVGGGYVGNQMEKSQTQVVYQISVRYDDGTWATVQQSSPMGLHVGDRVVVTDRGVELLQR